MIFTETFRNVTILALLAGVAHAQEAHFFRVAGPVPASITGFSADGYVTWTNEPTNATFIVQVAQDLTGPSNWVDYIQVPATNSVTVYRILDRNPPANMSLIPAGLFTMGNCMGTNGGDADELPLHSVYVSAFYMDKYHVTKALWDDVYQWATNHGYSFDNPGSGKAPNHPVQTVSWFDCVKWCNARSEKEGRVPAYYTDGSWTAVYCSGTNSLMNNYVNWNAGYRLPTEAEWEKAARGGVSGHRFPWSDTDTITHSRANYISYADLFAYDISPTHGLNPAFATGGEPYTNPVGYFAANGYRLYDMVGNVNQMCWDAYGNGNYYSSSPASDPHGPTGLNRVSRGGGYAGDASLIRIANRTVNGVSDRVGFRSVLPSPAQ